jgi:hypothetical protein
VSLAKVEPATEALLHALLKTIPYSSFQLPLGSDPCPRVPPLLQVTLRRAMANRDLVARQNRWDHESGLPQECSAWNLMGLQHPRGFDGEKDPRGCGGRSTWLTSSAPPDAKQAFPGTGQPARLQLRSRSGDAADSSGVVDNRRSIINVKDRKYGN